MQRGGFMHTPDGFVSSWICVLMILFSLGAVSYSLYRLKVSKSLALRMAAMSGLIFGLQMLNFPILNGTSGHFMGAAIAAIMLGPYAAIIVMASVIIVQTLLFGDGGLLAIGVNIFNMAIIGVLVANLVYEKMQKTNFSVFMASIASVAVASVSASLLMAASGKAPLFAIASSMVLVHILIGAAEGLVAYAIFFADSRLENSNTVFFAAAIIAALLAPFASGFPDGMESVAINLGFFDSAIEVFKAPMHDYAAFGSTILAGMIGLLVAGALAYSVAIKQKN